MKRFYFLLTLLFLMVFGLLGMQKVLAYYLRLGLSAAEISSSTADGNDITDVFKQFQFYVETISSFDNPNTPLGTSFTEVGDLIVTQLIDHENPDDEGLNDTIGGWELTGHWNDLKGSVVGGVVYTDPRGPQHTTLYFDYFAGEMKLYADDSPDYDFGFSFGSEDEATLNFLNRVQAADLHLVRGTGTVTFDSVGNFEQGTVYLDWKFSSVLPGFWMETNGKDINDYILTSNWYVISGSDYNTDHYMVRTDELSYFKIDANHDGSMKMKSVPEPATFLLLGTGLLGIAGIGNNRRKRKRSEIDLVNREFLRRR